MVPKIFFAFLFTLQLSVTAQTIETRKETARIEGLNTEGYHIVIASPEEEVRSSLSKYLKVIGKTKLSGDYITLSGPVIGGKQYPGVLYATTKQIPGASAAWMGMSAGNGEESAVDRDIEKLVYEFGVMFHREQIQKQIDEALRALQIVEKQQARLLNQHKDLHNRIDNNKREKIELEKSLVENNVELDDLTRKLAANAKAQDSVFLATGQIKKVVEMHKQSQQRIK